MTRHRDDVLVHVVLVLADRVVRPAAATGAPASVLPESIEVEEGILIAISISISISVAFFLSGRVRGSVVGAGADQ